MITSRVGTGPWPKTTESAGMSAEMPMCWLVFRLDPFEQTSASFRPVGYKLISAVRMCSQSSFSLLLLLLVPLLLLLLAFVPCAYAAPQGRTSGRAFASRRNDDQDALYALQVIVASSSFLKLVHTVSQGACDRTRQLQLTLSPARQCRTDQ